MKPLELADLRVSLSPNGAAELVVNGQDILASVTSFAIIVEDGKPPVLAVRVPAGDVSVEGLGVVQVEPQVPADPRAIVLAFLDSLSPKKVEEEAFAQADYSTMASEAIIEHLKSLV